MQLAAAAFDALGAEDERRAARGMSGKRLQARAQMLRRHDDQKCIGVRRVGQIAGRLDGGGQFYAWQESGVLGRPGDRSDDLLFARPKRHGTARLCRRQGQRGSPRTGADNADFSIMRLTYLIFLSFSSEWCGAED